MQQNNTKKQVGSDAGADLFFFMRKGIWIQKNQSAVTGKRKKNIFGMDQV